MAVIETVQTQHIDISANGTDSVGEDLLICGNYTPENLVKLHRFGRVGLITLSSLGTNTIKLDAAGTNVFPTTKTFIIGSYTTTDATDQAMRIDSTTRGFLPPRMSTAQKNAIGSPSDGLMVFDIGLNALCIFYSAGWHTITAI